MVLLAITQETEDEAAADLRKAKVDKEIQDNIYASLTRQVEKAERDLDNAREQFHKVARNDGGFRGGEESKFLILTARCMKLR
jgi:hypothetical protein